MLSLASSVAATTFDNNVIWVNSDPPIIPVANTVSSILNIVQIGSYLFLAVALVFWIVNKIDNVSGKGNKQKKFITSLILVLALLLAFVILMIKIIFSGTQPIRYIP